MLYAASAREKSALGMRKKSRKPLKTDSPEVDHRSALPGNRVVLAPSNFRSDPFGTVFPIGLGEPWGTLWRIAGVSPFSVGAMGLPRVLVCIEGGGEIEQGYATYAIGKGDVLFLPAVMGPCTLWPRGAVNLLEIALPE